MGGKNRIQKGNSINSNNEKIKFFLQQLCKISTEKQIGSVNPLKTKRRQLYLKT